MQSSEPGQADGMDVTDSVPLPLAQHYMIDVTSFTFKNQSVKLELKLVKGAGNCGKGSETSNSIKRDLCLNTSGSRGFVFVLHLHTHPQDYLKLLCQLICPTKECLMGREAVPRAPWLHPSRALLSIPAPFVRAPRVCWPVSLGVLRWYPRPAGARAQHHK